MEKTMTVEERIRRAENIYNKRNGVKYRQQIDTKRNKEKNIKKIFMQMFIFLAIYIIFYTVTNREHIFSEEYRNEVSSFFTEKTKINEWYLVIKSNIESFFGLNDKDNKQNENNTEDEENKKEEEESNKQDEVNNEQNQEEKTKLEKENDQEQNIGGAVETEKQNENKELSEEEQMKNEAKDIKSKISFVVPIKGQISSTFGWRNPTTASVPKYHTGIDIAANEGTKIKSATDGEIIVASSQGDFGNHYQIKIQDIIIVYAHCKKLYFRYGQTVKQGQEIAEVGTTGNSTGPHLHFEIRKGEKKIDPQLILEDL